MTKDPAAPEGDYLRKVSVRLIARLPLFGLMRGRKCLEFKPRAEKVCTTTPQLASLPEAVIRGGGCSGRVSFN
jgi:hypothetical protein